MALVSLAVGLALWGKVLIATTATLLLVRAITSPHRIGIVYGYASSIDFVATHRADDFLGISFLYLKEGEARKEVNLTNLHAPWDALVDELNELVGEHSVELPEVDEESLHPFFGYGIALVTLLAFFTFARKTSLVIGFFDGLFALVVVEESAVLQEHQTAHELFTVDPVKLAYQIRKYGVECRVFGELDTLDTICQMEELLFADSLPCGELLSLDGGMGDTLDITQTATLTAVTDSDGDTHLTCSCGAPTAVRIALDVIRQTIVDDVGEIVHIQTTSCHVRGDKKLEIADAELLHHVVTLCLR